jgi:cytochrome b
MQHRIRVWDLPTRLFHWSLAACLVGSLVAINLGGNAVAWHFRFGYAILALLLFRVAWGFTGPRYARFASFPPSPAAALRQLRAPPAAARPGHDALAALSVYAMLLALAVQAGTGLFANDAIMWDGPLKNLVSNAASDALTRVHKANRFVVIGLVLLHLGAIAYGRLARGRRLVGPMIGGDSIVEVADAPDRPDVAGATAAAGAAAPGGPAAAKRCNVPEPARDDLAMRLRALVLLAIGAALVWALVTWGAKAGSAF